MSSLLGALTRISCLELVRSPSILVDLQFLLFVSHPSELFIDTLVLPLREIPGLVVSQELLCDAPFALLLCQTLSAHIVLISYDGTHLEILREFL